MRCAGMISAATFRKIILVLFILMEVKLIADVV
jgi:hypothetical protein